MNPADSLPQLRARVRGRLCEIETHTSRGAKVDIGARMAALRLSAANHGLVIV